MQLKQPTKRNQSGFSIIEVLFVVLVVAVLAISGFVVYQHHKSTRREELLLDDETLRAVVVMRRMFSTLADQRGMEAMEALLQHMSKTSNNIEFLATLNKSIM